MKIIIEAEIPDRETQFTIKQEVGIVAKHLLESVVWDGERGSVNLGELKITVRKAE